jgi:hypothetical protein
VAGGRMTDVENHPLRYTEAEHRNLHGLIATNSVVHDRVVLVTQSILAAF